MTKKSKIILTISLVTVGVLFLFISGSNSSRAQYLSRLTGANIVTDIKEDDLKDFSKWGGKIVRILHNSVVRKNPPYLDSKLNSRIFEVTRQALDQGLAVVIAPGAMMDDHNTFFSSSPHREALIQFWKMAANEFKLDPRPIIYDLMNEPHDDGAKEAWSQFAGEITEVIRKIDTKHFIMVEPPEWGWPAGFKYLKPTGDPKTIYSFHFYGPMDFTHQRDMSVFPKASPMLKASEVEWKKRIYPGFIQGEMWNRQLIETYFQPAFEFAAEHNVSLWCGEFGVTRWAIGADRWLTDVIDVLEEHDVGWAYYSFREWDAMDLEMDPGVRLKKTSRSSNSLSRIIGRSFQRNPGEN